MSNSVIDKQQALEFIETLKNLISGEENIVINRLTLAADPYASYDWINGKFKVTKCRAIVEFNLAQEITIEIRPEVFKRLDLDTIQE